VFISENEWFRLCRVRGFRAVRGYSYSYSYS